MNTSLKIIENIFAKVNTNEILGAFAGILSIWAMLFICNKIRNIFIAIKKHTKNKKVLSTNNSLQLNNLEPTDELDVLITSKGEKLVTNLPTRLCLNTRR